MNDPRGSIWRKWDLHFHTPSSYDYENKSVTNEDIVNVLRENGISAVAITDHNLIDAERIMELKRLAGAEITIFPGIELRSELGGSETVHFIAIFPENSDLNHIILKIQNLGLTEKEIAEGGGHEKVYLDLADTAKILHGLGGVITVHAGTKSNSVENIKSIWKSKEKVKEDLLKDSIDFLEIGKKENEVAYRDIIFPDVGRILPIIMCSDNHNVNSYEVKTPCWIKADTTFEGLKQVLNEPEERVFIGNSPEILTRIRENPTKYIKEVKLEKEDNWSEETWFENTGSIPLNHELVAIIGNKGSGKSALSDSLGLVCNSKVVQHFSFLSDGKFRKTKGGGNKSIHFRITAIWEDDQPDSRLLSDDPDAESVEKAKYLPQQYLEKICTEIGDPQSGQFYSELQDVLFSRLDETKRQGFSRLEDLLEETTSSRREAIRDIQTRISEFNDKIVKLEENISEENVNTVKGKLEEKRRELQSHEKNKPAPIQEPEVDEDKKEELSKTNTEIKAVKQDIEDLEKSIKDITERKQANEIRRTKLNELTKYLENIESVFFERKKHIVDICTEIGMDADKLVSISIQKAPVIEEASKVDKLLKELGDQLDIANKESPRSKLTQKNETLAKLQEKLDKPQKDYQVYLKSLKDWEQKRTRIIGDEETSDTIKYYEAQLDNIKTIPLKIKELVGQRTSNVGLIHKELMSLIESYEEYYRAVQSFIDEHPLAQKHFRLSFNASVIIKNFEESFFDYVNQGSAGSFRGVEGGRKKLSRIVGKFDFNHESQLFEFLREVVDNLENNYSSDDPKVNKIERQLRKDVPIKDLYDYLYKLSYLDVNYGMTWDGKEMGELSPGERGALLLMFFLLIDNRDVPLIIDQPEENLDNQTVFELLVDAIKEAKQRRQIIIVTHNPNLAVVCDAEQIIYAEIDKKQRNSVTYQTGSIENKTMNKHIVDVLEGTRPAFENRDAKYELTR